MNALLIYYVPRGVAGDLGIVTWNASVETAFAVHSNTDSNNEDPRAHYIFLVRQ